VNAVLPKHVRMVKSRIQSGVAVVWMKLAKGAKVRGEREGTKVVLFVENGTSSAAADKDAEAKAGKTQAAAAVDGDKTGGKDAADRKSYPAPKAGPKVALKTGTDKGYGWLSLTLPSKVRHTITVEDDEAFIVFDKPARADLGRIDRKLPRNVK